MLISAMNQAATLMTKPRFSRFLGLLVVFSTFAATAIGCGEEPADASPADASATDSAVEKDAGTSDSGTAADTSQPAPDVASGNKCQPKNGKVSELKFDAPVAWAEPLKDYHDLGFKHAPTGKFLKGVQDLTVFDGRLYVGYGDANINLGSKQQLSIRYFDNCGSTKTTDEFKHSEEQIDRFRHIDGELWVAGIDATEDGWLGNVYRKEAGKPWVKHRTVGSGVHVHDIAKFDGAHYAVGSGNTPEGWKEGDIYGFLWQSKDNGKSFAPVDKEWNQTTGDARLVHLLPTGSRLYMFGYRINNQGALTATPNKIWDGKEAKYLAQGHPLQLTFVRNVWRISSEAGVLIGQDLLEGNNPPLRSWLMTAKGATKLDAFEGKVVVDVFKRLDTGEILVLTRPGTNPQPPSEGTKTTWTVWRSDDFSTFSEVLKFESTTNMESVAFWQGGLYLGAGSGYLFRSQGK